MGLDCSHGAYSGGYSSFNHLRRCVAHAMGGSYPPHWRYGPSGEAGDVITEMDPALVYLGDDYDSDTHPGLAEFLGHSDCDGDISPDMCARVADELEALLPRIEALGWTAHGRIARDGGYAGTLRRFIAGCRSAHAAGEPLLFR